MRTGRSVVKDNTTSSHIAAIVTGATTVFTQDLCRDMFTVQRLTGDNDISGIAGACACRLLKSSKCAELERIVTAVVESPDGLPQLEHTPLLAEVLQVYSEAARAERTGASTDFRRNTLVPAIVHTAMESAALTESDTVGFLSVIDAYKQEWNLFVPATPFQHIVVNAISGISI